jgi:glycogen operon protein
MTEQEWVSGRVTAVGMFLNGDQIAEPGPRGELIVDDSFLVVLNGTDPATFVLPGGRWARAYQLMLDTAIFYASPEGNREGITMGAGEELYMEPRSMVVLRKTD